MNQDEQILQEIRDLRQERNRDVEARIEREIEIHKKIDAILVQATKTNGRVLKLEADVEGFQISHQNCPGKKAMEFVTDYQGQEKVKKTKKYEYGTVAIYITIAAIILKGIDVLTKYL